MKTVLFCHIQHWMTGSSREINLTCVFAVSLPSGEGFSPRVASGLASVFTIYIPLSFQHGHRMSWMLQSFVCPHLCGMSCDRARKRPRGRLTHRLEECRSCMISWETWEDCYVASELTQVAPGIKRCRKVWLEIGG